VNALVLRQIERLQQAAQNIETALTSVAEKTAQRRQERERAQQEQWRLRKDIAALRHSQEDYERLAGEHECLQEACSELRDGLQTILRQTKNLRSKVSQ
jgi:chromosome segregation ATPase